MNTITKDQNRSTTAITINLPFDVADKLQNIATVNDTDFQGLIVGYVEEGMHNDMPSVRKKCFFNHIKEIMKKHNVPSEAIAEIENKFT